MGKKLRKLYAQVRLWWSFDYCFWHQEPRPMWRWPLVGGCRRCYDLKERCCQIKQQRNEDRRIRNEKTIARLIAIARGQA